MASLNKTQAQNAVFCEMCEIKINVNWYCVNCEQFLCEVCGSLHTRTKHTRDCEVIPRHLKELRIKRNVILSERECSNHTGEFIKFVCQKCNSADLCFRCVLENHSDKDDHGIKLIATPADKKANERLQYQVKALKDILKRKAGQVETLFQETNLEIERRQRIKADLNAAVHARAEVLQQEVTTAEQKMLQRVDKLFSDSQTHLEHTLGRCGNVRIELDNIRRQLEMKQETDDLSDLQTLTKENISRFKTTHLPDQPDSSFNFSLVPKGTVDDIFGNLSNDPVKPETSIRGGKPNVYNVNISEYIQTQHTKGIGKICPVINQMAWILRSNKCEVEKIDRTGKSVKRLETPFIVQDFTVSGDKDMVLTGDSTVWTHDLTLEKSPFTNIKNLKPFCVRGITMATTHDVLVCANMTGERKGKVVRLTLTGEVTMEICDDSEDSILYDPYRVAYNFFNEDIALACGNNVLVYSSSGELKLKWSGLRSEFNPHGITYDNYGNILVSCYNNNLVYMLEDGQTDGHILLDGDKHKMIVNPWAIAVDVTGRVWLAGAQGAIHVIKYIASF
ncbi:uncharacterized protein [Argopecten irradians]|uniref:uncharacterized protein n=1 Tax=Argopecten irradians TaxID=31199 RepID=UPI00371CEB59